MYAADNTLIWFIIALWLFWQSVITFFLGVLKMLQFCVWERYKALWLDIIYEYSSVLNNSPGWLFGTFAFKAGLEIRHFEKNSRRKKLKTQGKNSITQE